MNDVRDRGRVEQCLKDHVTQKKITAKSNNECFSVILVLLPPLPFQQPRFT